MKRAQSSVEFLLLSSAMVVGLTLIIVVSHNMLAQVRDDQQQASLRAVENAIVRELDHAAITVEGYERTFSLPRTIDGNEYSITILEESPPRADVIILTWRDTTRRRFVPHNISGSLQPGENLIEHTANGLELSSREP